MALLIALAKRMLCGRGVIAVGVRAEQQQCPVEQFCRKLAQRKLHPPVMLDEAGLRRERGHGNACHHVVLGRYQVLQQRREHRVDVSSRVQPQRHLRLECQCMNVPEQGGFANQRLRQRVLPIG